MEPDIIISSEEPGSSHISRYDYMDPSIELGRLGGRRSVQKQPSTRIDHLNDANSLSSSSQRMARRLNVTMIHQNRPYDISYRPEKAMLYSPPRQRQRWGETQVLPRTDYGDLCFDLFYVGATYNVSNILVDDPSRLGLLYAAGTFLPLMGFWIQKVAYDARFVYEDDLYHRISEFVYLLILAVAVLHVRTDKVMSNGTNEISMFIFALMLVLERIHTVVNAVEVFFFGLGQPAMQRGSVRLVGQTLIPLSFFLAATILSAIQYFGENEVVGTSAPAARLLVVSTTTASPSPDPLTTATEYNIPIFLCLFGYVASWLAFFIEVVFCLPGGGRHKEINVPLNVDFMMHRNGEWTMLMLGESIFSLLIVDVPNAGSNFYISFYCGILTVVLLQLLHFQSQPVHAESHALRRHKNAGVTWSLLNQMYSLALVVLGAAYTFFLQYSDENIYQRRLAETTNGSDTNLAYILDRGSYLFSVSLAIIFFTLDAMTLLHLGVKESHDRCVCTTTRRKNTKGIILVMLRLCMLVFLGTLSLWERKPSRLSVIGLSCVLFQLLLRRLGKKYLSHKQVHVLKGEESSHNDEGEAEDEIEEAQWPNVTTARAESASFDSAPFDSAQ